MRLSLPSPCPNVDKTHISITSSHFVKQHKKKPNVNWWTLNWSLDKNIKSILQYPTKTQIKATTNTVNWNICLAAGDLDIFSTENMQLTNKNSILITVLHIERPGQEKQFYKVKSVYMSNTGKWFDLVTQTSSNCL